MTAIEIMKRSCRREQHNPSQTILQFAFFLSLIGRDSQRESPFFPTWLCIEEPEGTCETMMCRWLTYSSRHMLSMSAGSHSPYSRHYTLYNTKRKEKNKCWDINIRIHTLERDDFASGVTSSTVMLFSDVGAGRWLWTLAAFGFICNGCLVITEISCCCFRWHNWDLVLCLLDRRMTLFHYHTVLRKIWFFFFYDCWLV